MVVLVKEEVKIRFKLKGCKVCGGDLYIEGSKWRCLQCNREEGIKRVSGYKVGRRVKWE